MPILRRRDFLLSPLALHASSLNGPHPRLFLNAEGFGRLRDAIQGTHAGVWAAVKARADSLASRQPPQYEDHPPSPGSDEQLWQRPVGEAMPYLAMAYRLTGDGQYLRSAQAWALASCSYEHWSTGNQADSDLSAGHQSFGLAVLYDWLHDDLDPAARDTIRHQLIRRCNLMWLGVPRIRKPLLQNHLWVTITGLGAAALALAGEPEAGWQPFSWLELVREKYRGTESSLSPDGASQEGVPYWTYGVEYMLKWWHLAADLLGEHPTSGWWHRTAAYRLYLGLPRRSWASVNTVVDFADGPRSDYYGADHLMRRLAQLYRDSQAQWVAEELTKAGAAHDTAGWLNLIWYDPSVPAVPPANLPTLRHFEDLEIVSARSDWSGDESLVAFKCGPPGGHAAPAKFSIDPGVGHAHPDANHFVVFGCGEWLVRDDGYARKYTAHHNTLLVEGRGQLGEGGDWLNARDWFPGPEQDPKIVAVKSARFLDEMMGQAAPAYPPNLGVRSFMRRLFFLKPDVLVVVDEIEMDTARRLELGFHLEHPLEKSGDGAYLARGDRALLRLEPLTPEAVEIRTGDAQIQFMNAAHPPKVYEIRFTRQTQHWQNAVALSWAPANLSPKRVTLQGAGGKEWAFHCGPRRFVLNWGAATP